DRRHRAALRSAGREVTKVRLIARGAGFGRLSRPMWPEHPEDARRLLGGGDRICMEGGMRIPRLGDQGLSLLDLRVLGVHSSGVLRLVTAPDLQFAGHHGRVLLGSHVEPPLTLLNTPSTSAM